jgi:hypothetical protein
MILLSNTCWISVRGDMEESGSVTVLVVTINERHTQGPVFDAFVLARDPMLVVGM